MSNHNKIGEHYTEDRHQGPTDDYGRPGTRISIVNEQYPDEAIVAWAEFDLDTAVLDSGRARAAVSDVAARPDVIRIEVTYEEKHFLGPAHEIIDVALTIGEALGAGMAGAVAADLWKKAKAIGGGSKTDDPPPPLNRDVADHVARWGIGTRFGHGDWSADLDKVLMQASSEEWNESEGWRFVYRDQAYEYEVAVTQAADAPYATASHIKRKAIEPA